MKLRTLNHFEDAVDGETAWRRRELTTLLFSVRDARHSKQQVSLRSGLSMLYAHWEGWIKVVAELFVEYVNQQGLKHSELAAPFLGIALKKKISETEKANAASVHTNLADFMISGGFEAKAKLNSNVIRTESNLSSKVLLDITTRIGISFTPYELLSTLIDERLVGARNSIAHGEYLDLDEEKYEELHQKVLQMLNTFTTDVRESARTQRYRVTSTTLTRR